MPSIKPIQIVGFTPLGVILAERFSYSLTNISLVDVASSLSIDTHWQSVSLLCLINLLKQCRMLLSDNSKKFGVNVHNVKINEELIYAYIKLVTQRIQKYYLNLLKQRQVKLELFNDQKENDERLKENSLSKYESNNENDLIYVTYAHSSHPEFDQSPRLNSFHAIFQYLLKYPSVKLIGSNIFAFEFAHLLLSLGHNQIYLYRMNPNETSILPITTTNTTLVTFFQFFSKFIHEPLIRTVSDEKRRSRLHIIEQFHQFKMNLNAEGRLEYEKIVEPIMPISRTSDKTKKNKRTYLETFRQSAYESTLKLNTSNIHIDENIKVNEEPLDHFPPSSTFFVLTDIITPSDRTLSSQPSFPKAIRTFNSTPGSLILNIYETLRTISGDETIPRLTNIFLSVDHELCVIQNQITVKNDEFGLDSIIESQQHNLQRSVVNLHDLYKIIQRPVNQLGQLILYESQVFQNDAVDLQSLLLFFNTQEEIPKNELMLLFHNEYDWHNLLVLPDRITVKTNNRRNSIL